MIRQLCPHCLKLVELPDTAAGTNTSCPLCAKSFRVPGTYTPSVDPSAGPTRVLLEKPPVSDPSASQKPPGLVPPPPPANLGPAPAPPPGLVPPTPPSSDALASGKGYGFTLTPKILDWVPAACLTMVFILTFFSWVGTYPGGVRIFSQTPWQALFATMSVNSLPEDLLSDEKKIEEKLSMSWLMLAYLPLLVIAVGLAWIEKFAPGPNSGKWPAALAKIAPFWKFRTGLLGVLSIALLAFVILQTIRGFGLDAAVRHNVLETTNRVTADKDADKDASKKSLTGEERKKFVDDAVKNGPNLDTTPKRQCYLVLHGGFLAMTGLQTTMWLDLAILFHVLCVISFAVRFWLDFRGTSKPLPRLSMHC